MSDDEDLIDRLEKETLKTKKEAEEEEPDYDIEGELAGKDGEGSDDEGKKDDAANKDWKKASVEEVFERFDEDTSGFIDFDEFKLMLPELGVNISEAKALKYFRQCDTDGSGEIGLEELRVAMYLVDPNSGNTVGFKPNSILSPKDAFDMYDEDGSGNLDEDEFSLALEYMEMPVDDAKLEFLFHQADADGSGTVEYHEFKKIWIDLCNPRKELEKRDVAVPLFMTPWALKQKLAEVIDEEEDKEAHAVASAEAWRKHQINLKQKKIDVAAALARSRVELGNALDVAGQTYLFGSGTRGQFLSDAIRPGQVFDGFQQVDDAFKFRVAPNGPPQKTKPGKISDELAKLGARHVYGSTTEKKAVIKEDPDASAFDDIFCAPHCSTLWGRGVTEVGIGENTCFAVNKFGEIFGWGGRKHLWEKILPGSRWARENRGEMTHRSQVLLGVKGRLPWLAQETVRERAREKRHLDKLEEDDKLSAEDLLYKKLKTVTEYMGVFKPPPGTAKDKVKYMRDNVLPNLSGKAMCFALEVRGHLSLTKNKNNEEMCFFLYDDLKFELKMIGPSEQKRIKQIEMEALDFRTHNNREKADKFIGEIRMVWDILGEKQKEAKERHARRKYTREKNAYLKLERRYKLWRKREAEGDEDNAEATERGGGRVVVGGITARGPGPTITPLGGRCFSIGVGAHHVSAVHHTGDVYAWGDSTFGRLGIPCDDVDPNARVERTVPTLVTGIRGRKVTKVAAGYSHNVAVADGGQMYVWGGAASGKLGIGPIAQEFESYVQYPIPLPLPGDRRVRSISCGNSHSAAACISGELFVWGSGDGGRLGLGLGQGTKIHPRPTLVEYLVGMDVHVNLVACGSAHTIISLDIHVRTRGKGHAKITEYTGGEVLQCGAAAALGKFCPKFEVISSMKRKPVKSIACGNNHSCAVTVYGEVYSWGSNAHGCSGHPNYVRFNDQPTVIRCLFVSSKSLGLDKPSDQSSVYNKRLPILANNGDISGDGEEKCIHTQMDQNPWWEVDLGRLAVIHTIDLWNREDVPADPSLGADYFSRRLFPCWIMVSESPFEKTTGGANLSNSFSASVARKKFTAVKRRTTWLLPVNTIGRYVRVQLESTNYLHFAQLEIFGNWGTAKSVGPASSVFCGFQNTAVVIDVEEDPEEIELCYKRAVQADPYNAHILRQYKEYYNHYDTFGENISSKVRCLTCRGGVKCEMCILRQSWPVEKCEGYVKRAPGGRILRLHEICKLILDDPIKAVKWHKRKKKKKGIFGIGGIEKAEYEDDDEEGNSTEKGEERSLAQKLLEEDEAQLLDAGKLNEDDIDLLLEDSVDEHSEADEEELKAIKDEIEAKSHAHSDPLKGGLLALGDKIHLPGVLLKGGQGDDVAPLPKASGATRFFSRLFGRGSKVKSNLASLPAASTDDYKEGTNGKLKSNGEEMKESKLETVIEEGNDDDVSQESARSKGSNRSQRSTGSNRSRRSARSHGSARSNASQHSKSSSKLSTNSSDMKTKEGKK